MTVIEAAQELLRVLKEEGGFTNTKRKEMLRDHGDVGEPYTAMQKLEEALTNHRTSYKLYGVQIDDTTSPGAEFITEPEALAFAKTLIGSFKKLSVIEWTKTTEVSQEIIIK